MTVVRRRRRDAPSRQGDCTAVNNLRGLGPLAATVGASDVQQPAACTSATFVSAARRAVATGGSGRTARLLASRHIAAASAGALSLAASLLDAGLQGREVRRHLFASLRSYQQWDEQLAGSVAGEVDGDGEPGSLLVERV